MSRIRGLKHARAWMTAALGATALAAGMATSTGVAAASGPTIHGCPYGAFCIYPQLVGTPRHLPSAPEAGGIFFAYGAHNLSGQYGTHLVYNNQYGGAGASLCNGYNGTGGLVSGSVPVIGRRGWSAAYFTPINSITLWLPHRSSLRTIACRM